MIYGKLSGGLGNQLFIACYTLAIAEKQEQSACLVTHGYSANTRPLYFDTILEPFKDLVWGGSPSFLKLASLPTITDASPGYTDASNIFLNGYFQKWSLIRDYVPTFAQKLDLVNRFRITNRDDLNTTIALHFRRGDYMKAPFNKVYHILPNQYYKDALAYLQGVKKWTKVIICCEQSDWKNLIQPIVSELQEGTLLEFERPSCKTDWEEFALMAQCGAVVTANSSFSYWAALLGQVKTVIRPTQWWTQEFKETPHPGIVADDPSDICPPEWVPI